MSDISKINPNGTEYNLKDATARAGIESSKTLKSSVVTVNDAAPINAEDITVDITPVQDLHGYDRPWAGGAWKNKLPMTLESLKARNTGGTWSGNVYTRYNATVTVNVDNGGNIKSLTINGTPNEDFNFIYAVNAPLLVEGSSYSLSGCPTGGSVSTYYQQYSNFIDGAYNDLGNGVAFPEFAHTYQSRVVQATIKSGYNAQNLIFYPMIRLATETDATFAPYSNECPIEGRTGAELDRVGKNLAAGIENGSWSTITQQKYGNIQRARVSNIIRVIPSETYTFNIDTQDGYITYARIAVYPELNRSAIYTTDWLEVPCSYTIPSGGKYVTIEYGFTVPTNHPELYTSNAQFELGSTPTAYEPYQGQQYTASFGETVHGGKWHVTAGGTDKTHGNIANYNGETINEPWLSSLDEYVAGATPTTGAQVVYPLTTPTTISTPKQNVPMLQGINTVSADCGDTSLKYQPDNVIGELKGEIQRANSFVERMALVEGSGAKDFSYGGWSFRLYIYRSMGQISMSLERIAASNVIEQAVIKTFMGESDYRAPEYLRPISGLFQAATYTTPSGWAIQVHLTDGGYIMFEGMAPEVGASAPTSSNWNLVEPWATHQQAKDLFNN